MVIGRNITHYIRERGLTIPKLAARAGMDKGNLSRIISSGEGYSAKSLDGIATALGVKIADLFAEAPDVTLLLSNMRMIPLLDGNKVGAFVSDSLYFRENEMPEYRFTSSAYSLRAFQMRVRDEAMVPDFNPGDEVIVDPETPPGAGRFVVAETSDGVAVIKRFAERGLNSNGESVFELLPSNSHYASWRSDQMPIKILGVVRERIVKLQL